jgi:hypothetical protein
MQAIEAVAELFGLQCLKAIVPVAHVADIEVQRFGSGG